MPLPRSPLRKAASPRAVGPILQVDFRSPRPIYLQLRDGIVAAIGSGALRAGTPLPSLRRLSEELGVNLHTVHRAYDVLRQNGFVGVDRSQRFVVRGASASEADPSKEWEDAQRRLLSEGLARGVDRTELVRRIGVLLKAVGNPAPHRRP
ncbi:MAG: GntR family transcriptional regulator [Thermoplasmata archaeon]|nr:GntR family transcriptional regulator [Thermoplasmata archaeon]